MAVRHIPEPDSADSMRALNTRPFCQGTSMPHTRSIRASSPGDAIGAGATGAIAWAAWVAAADPSVTITELSAPG